MDAAKAPADTDRDPADTADCARRSPSAAKADEAKVKLFVLGDFAEPEQTGEGLHLTVIPSVLGQTESELFPVEDHPQSSIKDQEASTKDQRSSIKDRDSSISDPQSSAAHPQPSAGYPQTSSGDLQSSTVYIQSSSRGPQSSAGHSQASSGDRHISTGDRQLPTGDPQSSTGDPQSSTGDGQPSVEGRQPPEDASLLPGPPALPIVTVTSDRNVVRRISSFSRFTVQPVRPPSPSPATTPSGTGGDTCSCDSAAVTASPADVGVHGGASPGVMDRSVPPHSRSNTASSSTASPAAAGDPEEKRQTTDDTTDGRQTDNTTNGRQTPDNATDRRRATDDATDKQQTTDDATSPRQTADMTADGRQPPADATDAVSRRLRCPAGGEERTVRPGSEDSLLHGRLHRAPLLTVPAILRRASASQLHDLGGGSAHIPRRRSFNEWLHHAMHTTHDRRSTMVSLSFTSLTTLINREDLSAFTSFLNNRNVAVDDRDDNGTTAMMVAAEKGHPAFIHALVEFGADVNLSDLDNWTALHFSAKEGHVESVRELLEAGANTEAKDMGGWTPLLWAAYQHRTETVRTLLEAGANPNVPGQHHMTALVWASGRGYLDVVQLLLEHGAKVNINDKFGTSPLIWACRKGFSEIVSELLKAGANVDASGMYSWTPLLLAVKGGHADIVDMLVSHKPNLNVMDKDGITPLIMAAKEGSYEIVSSLVNSGAYINLQDRSGDTCLICAARGGHTEIVELLLKKYADINIVGKEHKTGLYWAVEKNHYDIVKMLLEVHADTETTTKDGDTALLRAVRNRQSEMVELLLDRKARIAAADVKGDTCLHIAMRARSRHIVEILLRNPKHSKLLYRPNKAGETPYNIDIAHKRAILGDIFGARKLNTNEENENRLGYDLYSGALADFLSEPALTVPISVGLYAKWGSGKSFLLGKLTEEMRNFAQQWLEPVLELEPFFLFLLFNLALILGVVFGTGFCNVTVGLAVGCTVTVILIVAVFVLKFFGTKWEYEGLCAANARVARAVSYLQLLARITFCHPPGPRARRDKMRQIRFFFAQRASVTSAGRGDNSIVQMISSLYNDIEQHCGLFACRLFRAFRPQPVSMESESSFRHLCLVPYAFIFLWTFYVAMATLVLTVHFFTWEPLKALAAVSVRETQNGTLVMPGSGAPPPVEVDSGTYQTIETLLIVLSVTLGIVVMANILTIGKVLYALVVPHRLYLRKLAWSGGREKDRYVQALKDEVRLLIDMVRCMDSLTDEQTRLVVVVDGLDSCEQEKVLEILDMVNTLFTEPEAPFVILLSIDPHIISKAVELNINKVFSETAISGNDYLKNLIHLPFFLQNSALRKVNLAQKVAASRERRDTWIDSDNDPLIQQHAMAAAAPRRMSVESVTTGFGSKSRLRLPKKTPLSRLKGTESITSSVASNLNRMGSSLVTGTSDLNRVLLTDDYFSDVNPRSMRRLMNVIYISGRLVKAFHIDFNWYHLASWINITEQWPYRTTWMILYFEFNESKLEDRMSLYELYTRIRVHIPSTREADPLSEYDRDEKKLDVFLSFHKHTLTLSDLKVFLPFTINLDPFIKKVVKEEHFDPVEGQLDGPTPVPPTAAPAAAPATATDSAAARLRNVQPMPPPATDMSAWAWPYPAWSPPMPPPPPPPAAAPAAASAPLPYIQLPSICQDRQLSTLTVDEVCHLVAGLAGISSEAAARYHRTLRNNNISGWVLCACELPALKKTMKMTFGDWETFRAAVETLRQREAAAAASAGADTAEARKIRFQLTTEGGKVTQANSSSSSTVTSPLASESHQGPAASQSGGQVRRRVGTENHLEKQVTLEEQMIRGALQTLNEDACEDVREEQEVMEETVTEPAADGGEQEEETQTAVLYLQRSPGSPPVPSSIEEAVGPNSNLSRSCSVLSVRAMQSLGGAATPERRRPRTISVRSVRPASLVSSYDARSPPPSADDADRLSVCSGLSEAAGPDCTSPGSPRRRLHQLKEYLVHALPQKARATHNGRLVNEATPLVELARPGLTRQGSVDRQSDSREGTPQRASAAAAETTPLMGDEEEIDTCA